MPRSSDASVCAIYVHLHRYKESRARKEQLHAPQCTQLFLRTRCACYRVLVYTGVKASSLPHFLPCAHASRFLRATEAHPGKPVPRPSRLGPSSPHTASPTLTPASLFISLFLFLPFRALSLSRRQEVSSFGEHALQANKVEDVASATLLAFCDALEAFSRCRRAFYHMGALF